MLDHGEKIAEGNAEQVRSNEQVLEAYLGRNRQRACVPAMPELPPMLEFRSVNTYYGELHVLKERELRDRQGRDRLVCSGGNACGKSTTMKAVLGIVRPSAGRS